MMCPFKFIARVFGGKPDLHSTDFACVGDKCALWDKYAEHCGLVSQAITSSAQYKENQGIVHQRGALQKIIDRIGTTTE